MGIIGIGTSRFVLYIARGVLYSECPLSEVPLITDKTMVVYKY